jgi:phosphoribosylanthranilate isomerase
MTWVKICGITNLEDALTAVEAGADALGFVFYEKSPRKTNSEEARKIVSQLPSNVEKIGVFVLQDSEPAWQIAEQVGLTGLQIHVLASQNSQPGKTRELDAVCPPRAQNFYPALPAAWLLGNGSVSLNLASFIEKKAERSYDRILLDSGTPEQPGGTGKRFDWVQSASAFKQVSREINVIVAGGLTPGNVAEAIRIMEPWGVDVASGVEASPGKKDPEKVRAFVKAVREAERGG